MASNVPAPDRDNGADFHTLYADSGYPLGPQESWPPPLKVLVDVMIHSDQAMLVAWGESLIALYNDAHALLIGDRHPETFGRPLFEAANDISDLDEGHFRQALKGQGSHADGLVLPMARTGRSVSMALDTSYTPIWDAGGVGGVLCLSRETTKSFGTEQRQASLLELCDESRGASEPLQLSRTGNAHGEMAGELVDFEAQTGQSLADQPQAKEDLAYLNAALLARVDEERALNERLMQQGDALQRAQRSLAAIFNASSEGLTLCQLIRDVTGRVVDYQVLDVNPAHRVLTGATREQMLSRPVSEIAPPIDPRWIQLAEKAVRSGKPQAFEVKSHATGRWLDIHTSPVDEDLFAQTFIDVTQRRETEEQRRRLLEEMNHRVMNNFQMVAGLLEMQARRSETKAVEDALQTAVRRVRSLSDLHQSLAESPDSAEVDMAPYLTAISEKLRMTIDDPTRIVLKVKACEAQIDAAIALPLGFVVNELVTNAIKYAFPEGACGEINVVFEPTEDRAYNLVIADGGKGLPKVVETKGTGLGMRLVRAFVSQIGGSLEVRNDPGVAYTVSVPNPRHIATPILK